MTREEAITLLKSAQLMLVNPTTNEPISDLHMALFMAISALEQEPITTTNNNEPITIIYPTIVCDDAISREAVMNEIKCWIGSGEYRYTNATDYLSKRIRELPSVTPSRHKGHWIGIDEEPHEDFECCVCGKAIYAIEDLSEYKYCPNCGAEMESSDDSN